MCSGDDGNYGSAAVCDIAVLQALSKRIHFGKFIAEAKFQSERERHVHVHSTTLYTTPAYDAYPGALRGVP